MQYYNYQGAGTGDLTWILDWIPFFGGYFQMQQASSQPQFSAEQEAYQHWQVANCPMGCHLSSEMIEADYGPDIWAWRGVPRPETPLVDAYSEGAARLTNDILYTAAGWVFGSYLPGQLCAYTAVADDALRVSTSTLSGQVPYGSTDLGRLAVYYRKTWGVTGTRNVAVFEYVEANGARTAVAGASIQGAHAERVIAGQLQRMGVNPSQVTRIYSELEPCIAPGGYCKMFIQNNFPQATVTYSFEYGDMASRQRGIQLLQQAVDDIFGQ